MAVPTTHGVLFDVGYCLLDEAPRLAPALAWASAWLDARGVRAPPARLEALYLQACLAPRQGIGGLLVQTVLAAGADGATARACRRELPWDAVPMPPSPGAADALAVLRAAGLRVGVLANQPASARADLERTGLAPFLDDVWLSEVVGLEKPDPRFFRLALDRWGLAAPCVAYVGDRPDNDVAPARGVGLHTVRVRIGPHARQPERGAGERADHDAPNLMDAARHLVGWASAAPRAPRAVGHG